MMGGAFNIYWRKEEYIQNVGRKRLKQETTRSSDIVIDMKITLNWNLIK
jgi:hypothetical protein